MEPYNYKLYKYGTPERCSTTSVIWDRQLKSLEWLNPLGYLNIF